MAGNVTRNRAGQIVKDTSLDLVSPLRALLDAGAGTVRGMTVGTLGAPAELLNLLRVKSMGGSDIPYNMEYWNKVLPSAGGSHDTAVGQALGEFVPLPNRVVMAPVKAVKAIPGAIRHGATEFARAGVPAHVIKPKGGNWLAGSVENAVAPLKQRVDPELEGYARRGQNLMPHEAEEVLPKIAINDWLETKLARYIRNEMGTPEDPVRELAERGVLHVDPENLTYGRHTVHPSGEVFERLGQSEAARQWETASDFAITPGQAVAYLHTKNGATGVPTLERNPWLAKVDPETTVYDFSVRGSNPSDLGFDHLVDELKNAMDPASGLPRHLQLDPKKLEKITVPQASELVAKINAWRAEQKIAADAHKANNAATVVHKEYPEQGYRWVELKQPSASMEGLKSEYLPEVDMWRIVDENGGVVSSGATEREALNLLKREERERQLADALKYEGETMGHCVGGYCPDVIEGRSRIFSLRDKKGEPHVTIEVKPGQGGTYTNDFRHWAGQEGYDLSNPEDLAHAKATFAAESSPQSSIIQIKGKANKKPKDEYLPFVQDFVRSGEWSEVGDAANAGLRKFNSVFNSSELKALQDAGAELPAHGYLTGKQVQELHNMITPENKRFVYDDFGNIIDDPYSRAAREQNNFAGGGLVGLEAKYYLNNNSRPEGFASGGVVSYNPAEIEDAVARLREDMYA